MRRSARGEGGFTLTELLAVIAIMGIVGFALTEAVIIGFKTTDATANDISRSTAVQALQSYFTGDAQSAKLVSRVDPAPACAADPAGIFLHLSWTEPGNRAKDVSYSLEADSPPISGQRDLVRWSCVGGGAPDKRMLGRFTFDPAGPLPVLALCDAVACPDVPGSPTTVTLKVPSSRPHEADPAQPTPGVDLTVRRRTSP